MSELQKFIAAILLCDPEALPSGPTSLRDIQGWDSLKHVLLVLGLEKKLNKQLTADEIQRIVTVDDIARAFSEKTADV